MNGTCAVWGSMFGLVKISGRSSCGIAAAGTPLCSGAAYELVSPTGTPKGRVISEGLLTVFHLVAVLSRTLQSTHLALVGLLTPTSAVVGLDPLFGFAIELLFLERGEPLFMALQCGRLAPITRDRLARGPLDLAGQPRQTESHS